GPGRLVTQLQGTDVTVVGIDRSFGMLREAVLSAGRAGWAQADIIALPFAEATFDRVAALGVLYHVRDWRVAVRELRRVCRPGGRLVISTTSRQTMQRLVDVHFAATRLLARSAMSRSCRRSRPCGSKILTQSVRYCRALNATSWTAPW